METSPITKQANEIPKRMQQKVYENPIDRDSYFWNNEVENTSVSKNTKDEDQNLSRVRELTDSLEIRKIMERHLKEENETYKIINEKLFKENEKISEEVEKLKTKNNILCTQAFRWLQEKNSWKAKYEKQKVKTSIYKK